MRFELAAAKLRAGLEMAGMRAVGRQHQQVARDEGHAALTEEEFAAAAQDKGDLIETVLVERGAEHRDGFLIGAGFFVRQCDAGIVRHGAFQIIGL